MNDDDTMDNPDEKIVLKTYRHRFKRREMGDEEDIDEDLDVDIDEDEEEMDENGKVKNAVLSQQMTLMRKRIKCNSEHEKFL
ncbi:MAG: hypothetical protein IPL12_06635 [Bacteroidetes bacterium]|nr:hypothetical protein [Bacteroidota bacterium]